MIDGVDQSSVAKGVAGACLVLKLNFSSVITKNLGPKFNPNAKTKITRIGVVKPQIFPLALELQKSLSQAPGH
jgi:hypothetical protein